MVFYLIILFSLLTQNIVHPQDAQSSALNNLNNDEEVSITYEDIDDGQEYNNNTNNNSNEDEEIEVVEEIIEEEPSPTYQSSQFSRKIIQNIIIKGNKTVPRNAIIPKIPFHKGQELNLIKTSTLIHNIYDMGYFNDIKVTVQPDDNDTINLIIYVNEKPRIDEIKLEGNSNLPTADIEKELALNEIKALDLNGLKAIGEKIKQLYQKKNYHKVVITPELTPSVNNSYTASLKIEEGPKSVVKRVFFKGNKAFSEKRLKSLIITQEDWLLGFLMKQKAGSYFPELIEQDKYILETFYQSNGFLTARVKKVDVDVNPDTQDINITFIIDEGELYSIKEVKASENEVFTEEELLSYIPFMRPGQLYSRENIRKAMDNLRKVWGNKGYVYADIDPEVIPDFDNKTVDITFHSEPGNKVFLNRITVIGNQKTRDYVVRRNIELNEGELLTTPKLELSQRLIENLGFFNQQGGVNYRILPVDESHADIEFILDEVKTGKLFANIGYGGPFAFQSPSKSIKVGLGVTDRNFLGTGISYNLNLMYSQEDQGILFGIQQPWLFGRPITGGLDIYHNKRVYTEIRNTITPPVEQFNGGSLNLGFIAQEGLFYNTRFLVDMCIEDIQEIVPPTVIPRIQMTRAQLIALQGAYNLRFQDGKLFSMSGTIGQDFRNHPIFPTRGYSWTFGSKFALPTFTNNFSYYRADLDFSYFTPLIGEYNLIFAFHTHLGLIKPFGRYSVPYRELFHIGGPATVRGFYYGQIGPSIFEDSLGGTKAFWLNTELIVPLAPDMSMRALLFYDGGASWDTLCPQEITNVGLPLRNNKFHYRHAIGFGIQITQPTPLRVYWGFKLDRNKRRGEKTHEVHFTMTQDF